MPTDDSYENRTINNSQDIVQFQKDLDQLGK